MITISRFKPVLLSGLAGMMMLAPRALPDTVSYYSSFTTDSSPVSQTIELAAFNPALGTLNSAQLSFSDLEDGASVFISVYAAAPAMVSYTDLGVTQKFTLTGPGSAQLAETFAQGAVTGSTAVPAGQSFLSPGDNTLTALGGNVRTPGLFLYEGTGNLDFNLDVGAVVGTGSATINPNESSGTIITFGEGEIVGTAEITYGYTPNIQAASEPAGIGLTVLGACALIYVKKRAARSVAVE